jgi:type IV fimbrial biogenesis protein FimT
VARFRLPFVGDERQSAPRGDPETHVKAPPRGFTLVELLVTLAVLAIVVVAGVPGFQSVVNGNRLAAASNETIAALQTARLEAIRRNRRVAVCASADANAGTSATCSASDPDGWLVFVDNDRDGSFGAGDLLLRTSTLDGPMGVGGASTVVYRSDGLARDVAGELMDGSIRIAIDTRHPVRNVRCVAVRAGGVSVQAPTANNAACS